MDLDAIHEMILTNEGSVQPQVRTCENTGSRLMYTFGAEPKADTILHGMYWIQKDSVADPDLQMLTIVPKVSGLAPSSAAKPFSVMSPHPKNKDWIGIPRFLGLSMFGLAATDKRTEGRPISPSWNEAIRLRPEQEMGIQRTMRTLEKWGGAFWIADCGFGKTKCISRLIYKIGRKTCVVVPQTILIHQMCAEFGVGDGSRQSSLSHAKVGILQGSWEKMSEDKKLALTEADIIVASLDSLSLFKYPTELWQSVGLVVFDEAHHMAARTLCRVLTRIPARHIVGFSATPHRSDGLSYLLYWILGPVSFVFQRLPAVTGLRHTVSVRPITTPYVVEEKLMWNGKPALAQILNELAESEKRNKFIFSFVSELLTQRKKILLITAFRSHAETLYESVLGLEPRTVLLHGGLKAKQKKPTLGAKVLVATYGVLQEGFDDAELDTLLMCTPRSTVQQVVGRIERSLDGKLIPLVIDFVDQYTIFEGMWWKRNSFYQSRGFRIEGETRKRKAGIDQAQIVFSDVEEEMS